MAARARRRRAGHCIRDDYALMRSFAVAEGPCASQPSYRVVCSREDISRKAEALAIEQSVEMPLEAITDAWVRREIVGRVTEIGDGGDGSFRVRVSLSAATTGRRAGAAHEHAVRQQLDP